MKYLLAVIFMVGILLFAIACAVGPGESPADGTNTKKTETSAFAGTPVSGTALETDTDRSVETTAFADRKTEETETETEEETTTDAWEDETVPDTTGEKVKVSDPFVFGDTARKDPIGILTCSPHASWEELLVTQKNGDALNEALYRRNLEVADRLQCTVYITSITGSGSDYVMYKTLLRNQAAGCYDYELAYGSQEAITCLFKNQVLQNLDEFEGFDPTASRWSTGYLEESSYAGGHYMVAGKGTLSAYRNLYVTLVDRTLLQTGDGKTLFDTVKNGEWTLDAMQTLLLENLPSDTDAFSLPDPNVYRVPYDGFLRAFGMRFLTHSQAGLLETADFDVMTNQMKTAQDRFLAFRDQSGVRMDEETEDAVLARLANGQVRATCNVLGVLEEPVLAERKAAFAALPIPKLTVQQAAYGMTFATGARVYGVLNTNFERKALVFNIMDALCSQTEETVVPVYLEELFGEETTQKDLISQMVSRVSPDPVTVYLTNARLSMADLMNGRKASSYLKAREKWLLSEVSEFNKMCE